MNNKNIYLFNYIYNSKFNSEITDDEKWKEFEKLCSKIRENAHDFVIENNYYLNTIYSRIYEDISGGKGVTGRFVSLNYNGEKEFYEFKCNQLEKSISQYGSSVFKNCKEVFENMKNEAIREILDKARDKGMINFVNTIFAYASNKLYFISYDGIKILFSSNEKLENTDIKTAVYNIYGNQINQNGNDNNATINIMTSDDKLFKLVSDKLSALEEEMKQTNKKEIEELKQALEKKDKKSLLTKLSELATVGSFIAQMVLMTLSKTLE